VVRLVKSMLAHVVGEQGDGVGHEGNDAGLASLSCEVKLRGSFEPQIAHGQIDHLLHSGAGVIEHTQQGQVSPSDRRAEIRLGQDCLHLFRSEIV